MEHKYRLSVSIRFMCNLNSTFVNENAIFWFSMPTECKLSGPTQSFGSNIVTRKSPVRTFTFGNRKYFGFFNRLELT